MEENGSAAMLATKRSADATLVVNLMEHVAYTLPCSTNKIAHSSFETSLHEISTEGHSTSRQSNKMLMNFHVYISDIISAVKCGQR